MPREVLLSFAVQDSRLRLSTLIRHRPVPSLQIRCSCNLPKVTACMDYSTLCNAKGQQVTRDHPTHPAPPMIWWLQTLLVAFRDRGMPYRVVLLGQAPVRRRSSRRWCGGWSGYLLRGEYSAGAEKQTSRSRGKGGDRFLAGRGLCAKQRVSLASGRIIDDRVMYAASFALRNCNKINRRSIFICFWLYFQITYPRAKTIVVFLKLAIVRFISWLLVEDPT